MAENQPRCHFVVTCAVGVHAIGEVSRGDRGMHIDQVGACALLRDDAADRSVVDLNAGLQHRISHSRDLGDEQLNEGGISPDLVNQGG